MARLFIDPERCIASEICVSAFPEALTIDEVDQIAVLTSGHYTLSEAKKSEIVTLCPMGAITLR